MHLSSKLFDYDFETKTWSTTTSKLKCAIPKWSPLFPGEPGDEVGIFLYRDNPFVTVCYGQGPSPDIIKFRFLSTKIYKHEIDRWELYPVPDHVRDFKLKGVSMFINNNQEYA